MSLKTFVYSVFKAFFSSTESSFSSLSSISPVSCFSYSSESSSVKKSSDACSTLFKLDIFVFTPSLFYSIAIILILL
jgi:hypothetical protein